jgi:hypothetical protein
MNRDQIFKIIYAGIAIFGSLVAVTRFMDGEWTWGLFPLAIVAFCVYRLLTMDEV